MQNFSNSPATLPPGFPSRGGNLVGSPYPPHISDPQISPRTIEDYAAMQQSQSILQSHGQHPHLRGQQLPGQASHIHAYGSRRGAGELPQATGSSSNSYRKDSMDYYFSVSGRDRNRRGGGFGAGFGYSNMEYQYRHVSGSGPSSGMMSPYPMDYSTSASTGSGSGNSNNSGSGSFSPTQQFSLAQNASMQPVSGGEMHQRQHSQKYPPHQGLHQGHRAYSLSGHRIPSHFGHYPPLNVPTASVGMYNSPPQRYEISSANMDSKISSPTHSSLNATPGPAASTNSGHQENAGQNYHSSIHPPYSPQTQLVPKHAARRTPQHNLGAVYDAPLKVANLPNTVQNTMLTDTVLSQKKRRDGTPQPHLQQTVNNQQKQRNATAAGRSTANEESGDVGASEPEEGSKNHSDHSEHEEGMTGSTGATLRNIPTDFDFGLGAAGSSGPGTDEVDKDEFTLLGPLPPPPPLPRPVQGSPPPSSSALSDIQQFTNTYQQLETRRGEQSAANLLRQKLQETGMGFEDYPGGDFYGATPPHGQSAGHHLLSRPPQCELASPRTGASDAKLQENFVPKGYFPSGKKKGRPVGSVNKQKRVQVQSTTSNVILAPHTPPAGSLAATPQPASNSSMAGETVIPSTLPEQKPCPSLDLTTESQPVKVEMEGEDNQPDVDVKPVKHKQRKGKEGNEGAASKGRQWRKGRGMTSKEELDPQNVSVGNAGTLQGTRKNVFSPYVHVERKITEIGAVCMVVNSEEEKSKAGGKNGSSGGDGLSTVSLISQMVRKEREIERMQEKGIDEPPDSVMQSGKSLPATGFVLPGPVISETGHTGRLLCCLCQKWANYKNLGDLYGPFYPADYAAKFPKNQPQIRQILSNTPGVANAGSNPSSVSTELTVPDIQSVPDISSVDTSCSVSQTTNPVSPAVSENLPCLSTATKAMEQNWNLIPEGALITLDPPELENELTQIRQQKAEDVQQRPQHRKLTSHPRFKRRHKSSEDMPRTIPINSKASLPFQPPPPSLDSLGPLAQLAQLPVVPLDPKELWVHESCIVWTSGVYLVNGRLYGLQEAIDGARETNCSHCEMAGSTLGCYSKGCTLRYHYLCAVEAEYKVENIQCTRENPQCTAGAGPKIYLQEIRGVVDKHKGSQINLKKVGNYSFKVGSLSETSCGDTPEMLEEWEEFYLPDQVSMEVIGVLEKFCCECSCNELVLMVCEDEKVYGYADNRLHLVANSLKLLFKDGVQFPGIKQYYRGQSFEDMTDAEWDRVNKSKVVRESVLEHKGMLACMKDSYLTNLDIIMGRSSGE
ncbi:transcription factor 20-like, partial [Clarias magur]